MRTTEKALAYRTVEIFSGILGRKLYLKDGRTAQTNGWVIEVPMKDPDLYTLVEHEISHPLFGSDPTAKALFVSDYTNRIVEVAAKRGVTIVARPLRKALSTIVGILEDERVITLWGLLYAGSERKMRSRARADTEEALPFASSSLVALLAALAGGHDPDAGNLVRFIPHCQEALQKVQHKDFLATLIVSKWLITRLVSELIAQTPKAAPDDRIAAMERLAQLLDGATLPNQLERRFDDFQESPYASDWAKNQAAVKANKALRANVRDGDTLETALGYSQNKMQAAVERIRSSVRNARTADDRARLNVPAKIKFADVEASSSDSELSVEDRDTIRRLKSRFFRVMGRRDSDLGFSGTALDVAAYIQSRIARSSSPPFRSEKSGRGFKSLILVDRSSSMKGHKTVQAGRACRIIARALDFPFTQTHVWGFSGLSPSEVEIVRFAPGTEELKGSKCKGFTPLHIALRVAAQFLEGGNETKQIFVISDGFPTHLTKQGGIGTQKLVNFVGKEVRTARARGVGVTGVIIGVETPRGVVSELKGSDMSKMFGSQAHWKRLGAGSLSSGLVQLVSSSFINYLKHA